MLLHGAKSMKWIVFPGAIGIPPWVDVAKNNSIFVETPHCNTL
jgi:hypothetical protein